MKMSDTARVNKTAIMCHIIIASLIIGAYTVEVIKGSRTILYLAMMALCALGPAIAELLIYQKNKDSQWIKLILGVGYAVLYAVAVFSTHSLLPFTYCIPLLVVVTLYSNPGYCIRVGAGSFLINIADVIYKGVTVGYEESVIPDIEIRVIMSLVVSIYVVLTTKVLNQINENKREELEQEKSKIEKLLQEVMRLSGELSNGIAQVDEQMSVLDSSSHEMGDAMAEVNSGTQDTAESVQNQLVRTEEIQKLIEEVGAIGKHIKEGMDTASTEVTSGLSNMDELAKQADKSRAANASVIKLMTELHEQAVKMEEIITIITNVANSTGMLALNASIEAARAGEAGKGFAVVATQVSELSDQTKSAAVTITDLIRAVVNELKQMTSAVDVLQENAKAQDEKTAELSQSLKTIAEMTENIAAKTQSMEKMIVDLSHANGDIVQNIQTISAVTQEVTAHSSETMTACEENRRIVNKVSDIAAQLNVHAQNLRNAQQM